MKRKLQLLPLFFLTAPILAGFSSSAVQKDQNKESPWWGWAVLVAVILLIVLWVMWVLSKKEKPSAEESKLPDQSRAFPRTPSPTVEAPVEAKSDDLKVIEGIGPKIEQLLYEAGIRTYRELASAKVETLEAVLEKAGPRFRLADPATWPKQAELAAEGKWDELKELQDSLKGGREA